MDNMNIWNKLSRPPKEALKTISGGRLKGMTDINPQWRLKAMTELFGTIGFGWKYRITDRWNEEHGGQVACFVRVELLILDSGKWSEPIEGLGGSMLLSQEKNGLYLSDEGYKMALTDALSVAMKQLGIAADIYAGLWDGSKYRDNKNVANDKKLVANPPKVDVAALVESTCEAYMQDHEKDVAEWFYMVPVKLKDILRNEYKKLTKAKQKSFDAKTMAEILARVKLEDVLEEVPA